MYTIVNRRKFNPDRQEETMQQARSEFFPKLQNAPGFVGFYLVNDVDNGINTVIVVWEDQASAQAFAPEVIRWRHVLDDMGHTIESDNWGETIVSLEGHAQSPRS